MNRIFGIVSHLTIVAIHAAESEDDADDEFSESIRNRASNVA